MKLRMAVIAVLCMGLWYGSQRTSDQIYAQAKQAAPVEQKITVLNPLGMQPSIHLKAQAPRPTTLDGKTIYFVNDGYLGTDNFLAEVMDWFKSNHPKTNLVYRVSANGGFGAKDPALWAEMKEKADAMVIGTGH